MTIELAWNEVLTSMAKECDGEMDVLDQRDRLIAPGSFRRSGRERGASQTLQAKQTGCASRSIETTEMDLR